MQKRQEELNEAHIKDGVRQAMLSTGGRRFLLRLFEWTDPLGNAMRDSSRWTAFSLGQQNVGKQLLALLEEVNPSYWARLAEEQKTFLKEHENAGRVHSTDN